MSMEPIPGVCPGWPCTLDHRGEVAANTFRQRVHLAAVNRQAQFMSDPNRYETAEEH